ncbi:hypothetical protein [Actinomyces succiniciruminis]|uniref:Uncharacterized protein n=1 Tax=Actinomyces succiniciruminis TaxID=1522002 RepID=A0A1L7RLX7_9ACTO|nr:hypothetical protein [Actinomyces succiniciruminis]CED92179.1 Hypothetical protein AAM4_2347 [Actinomyces succiniciruminis]
MMAPRKIAQNLKEAVGQFTAELLAFWAVVTGWVGVRRERVRRSDALTALETAAVTLDRLTPTSEVRYARTRLDAAYTALVVGDVVAVDSLYCAPPWVPPSSPPSAASPADSSSVRMCVDKGDEA